MFAARRCKKGHTGASNAQHWLHKSFMKTQLL